MSGKNLLLMIVLLALLAAVYSFGSRLSADTLNVMMGLFCGVAASVPVTIGLVIALTRDRREAPNEEPENSREPSPYGYPSSRQPYPPVIVVAPPQPSAPPYAGLLPPGYSPGYNMHEPPMTRDFRIIGEDDDWDA